MSGLVRLNKFIKKFFYSKINNNNKFIQ
jgi:hypothetical protein